MKSWSVEEVKIANIYYSGLDVFSWISMVEELCHIVCTYDLTRAKTVILMTVLFTQIINYLQLLFFSFSIIVYKILNLF